MPARNTTPAQTDNDSAATIHATGTSGSAHEAPDPRITYLTSATLLAT
jgi:hypothetical protein